MSSSHFPSSAYEMHRPMLPDSQGDDHHRITNRQSTWHLWKSKVNYSESSSKPMALLSTTIVWFQIIKIRNPKDRARPSSPWGLRPRLSTPTTGFEPATFRLIAGCATAAPHGLVWCFLTKNWFKSHKFSQVKMFIPKWSHNSRGNA